MRIKVASTGAELELTDAGRSTLITPSDDFNYDDPRNREALTDLIGLVSRPPEGSELRKVAMVAVPGGNTQDQMSTQALPAGAGPQLVTMDLYKQLQQQVAQLQQQLSALAPQAQPQGQPQPAPGGQPAAAPVSPQQPPQSQTSPLAGGSPLAK